MKWVARSEFASKIYCHVDREDGLHLATKQEILDYLNDLEERLIEAEAKVLELGATATDYRFYVP